MGSGYSLKKSAREPRPPFTTNLECSIQQEGDSQLGSLGQAEQSPAVAAGTLARPASRVYVRNSDAAGACPLRTLPKIQMAQTGAEICKGVQVRSEWGRPVPSGKGGGARENYLGLPGSESDCRYQPRETDFSGISPAPGGGLVCIRGQLSLEAGLRRLLAFAFVANCYIGSHLAFPPRERGSPETGLQILWLQSGRRQATYY